MCGCGMVRTVWHIATALLAMRLQYQHVLQFHRHGSWNTHQATSQAGKADSTDLAKPGLCKWW
jgi:hypothetical protein